MAARPLSQLVSDIEEFIEEGRAAAGPKIIVALKMQGPWWTGEFGRRWKLSPVPVKPVELTQRSNFGKALGRKRNIPEPDERPSVFYEKAALRIPIDSPLYIGNSVSYAGFAVGNENAKVYRPETGEYVNYREHKEGPPPRKLTSKDGRPDWYELYTTAENGGLLDTLDQAFNQSGQRML